MSKPTISVDFDGVLHSYESGWQGKGVVADGPVPGAIEWLYELYCGAYNGDHPLRVAIYSSRSSSVLGRHAMKRWLRHQIHRRYGEMAGPWMDPVYDDLPKWVTWPWFKPPALVTVDDRAIRFDGDFSDLTPSTLLSFRPWNRRAK